ncbi:T6SS immunity protein Tli4 family protein [uncultured Azohydromonas sp.]|uniref:T6SS immunity protein Tli4 family protein n=1 Tax=uncultured Azohydromonas sp. TaxID=487342 RepID=UPI002613B349|nr:T6SS immunity protein Tli4 family protein [uncultured Azohydromonas sp.]
MKIPNRTPLTPRLQKLFENTRTVCFGRLVIDIPATATAVYGFSETPLPTERLAGEGARIQEWIDKRLKKIEEDSDYALSDLKEGHEAMYGKVINGLLPMQKIVFGAEDGTGSAYKIESFIRVGNDVFVQSTIANTSRYAAKYGESVPEAVMQLNDSARALRLRADDEIPDDVGVCIDGAFISKPLGIGGENFSLGVRLNEFPDVHFSIATRINSRDKQQETIDNVQRRQKEAEKFAQRSGYGAWYANIKFLRRGEREFNGSRGYELLARKPAQGSGTENHQFVFEGGGETKNELRPAFDMQMDTGASNQQAARVPPSLSDEEAVALWDKLVSSIRVRPTGVSKTGQPRKAPLGERHVTGRTCPQTGWWECDDDLNLAQRPGIWLEEGQRMPMALVWRKPSLWQQLKGERPVGKAPAVWRLAAYEAPPGGQGRNESDAARQPPPPTRGTSGS